MKPSSLLLYSLLFVTLVLISGCSTPKGPKTVTAYQVIIPNKQASTQEKAEQAPRTKPGIIMDPEAITWAQVPKRIIYFPGEHGIFSRSSSKQEVSYRLVPVERIGEIQAAGSPWFEEKPEAPDNLTFLTGKDVWSLVITELDGKKIRGTARRLGVIGKTESERIRAESLLRKKEMLRWTDESGWIGFTPEEILESPVQTAPKIEIPPIPEIPHGTPPHELETISGAGADQTPNQEEIPQSLSPQEKEHIPDIIFN